MTVMEADLDTPLVVGTMSPGDTFGCTSFFSGEPAAASILCQTDCKILQIDEQRFTAMLARWPKLYKKFAETLSQRLHTVNESLMEIRHREILRAELQNQQIHSKFYGIWGAEKTNSDIDNKLDQLAASQGPVLFIGEHGTGRKMAAWFLHIKQLGEKAPFIVIQARHFAETWADTMELAKKGTLYIEEINLLEGHAQKLLEACLAREDCGFRLIGSMTKPPGKALPPLLPELEGFFKLSLTITPLRTRKRDIPALAAGILDKLSREENRPKLEVDREAMKLLLSHDYREGNMTELIQVLKRAYYLADGNTIGLEHIFFGPTAQRIGQRVNLLEWPGFAEMLKKGRIILWLRRLGTALSLTILMLLFLGPNTPVGLLTLPFIWGLGWPLMAMVSPSFGRVICTVCPVSYMMEKIQKVFHLNLRVPEIIKKYDYFFITFLFAFIFWIESVSEMRSNPVYTGLLFSAIMSMAFVTGILYSRHAWCHHLFPMGNFIGMASIGSFAEVRADTNVCINKCTTFDCYRGTAQLEGCPMSMQLPYVDNNLACKLCFNCVRNCPNGAVQVNLRVPARDVWH
ncbi:MAG TPA: cyclic nucleotide-binding domain-containing protein, partial [Bacillota bacterium]|nr:cyclic nucleotide-binding domain-containing protein [Bacillota bacterium]